MKPAPIQHPNVNWVNGMKIRKEHFIQQDNAYEDKLQGVFACFLNRFNYGLLPSWDDGSGSYKVVFQVSNQNRLDADVQQLRAVTPGGVRIEWLQDSRPLSFSILVDEEIEAAKKGDTADYYVLLTIDAFSRQAYGVPDPEEEPPRYPFAGPTFKANLMAVKDMPVEDIFPWSLCIGKVTFTSGAIEINEDYIPPCASMQSHQKLIDFGLSAEKFFNQLELNVVSIIRKIREKDQDSTLSKAVYVLSDHVLTFCSTNNLKLKWQLPVMPPLALFEHMAGFARIIRNTIDCNTAAHKEEMLNYFTSWSEIKQGDFEQLLLQTINFDYRHHEVMETLFVFAEFAQVMSNLFAKLESLAYIGKKKETNIFVKEQTSKRSFLID